MIEEIDEEGQESSCCGGSPRKDEAEEDEAKPSPGSLGRSRLTIELLVIDLETCARCVPTDAQLKAAVKLLTPIAEALGIEFFEDTIVVTTPEEAMRRALLSSPTIRINGRDITQDVRESRCESCGDISGGMPIDCREWYYKGKVYSSAPMPMLVEEIMKAMLAIGDLPVVEPKPLGALPENLNRFFAGVRGGQCCS
ncbi:MAG: DUF2703 domain-containing protein [Candidatus Moduliflexus flocculans]|nr:DUF2703 domain-containing protein [Candidatus Moduliflexus flocculans]